MGRYKREVTPGPGAYEVPEFMKISVAPSEVPTLRSPMFRSSSAQRKPLVTPNQGDPGAYVGPNSPAGVHQGQKEDIAARSRRSFNRNVGSGRAAFNSTSAARASTPPPRSARGGPGEHDYDHLYACGQASSRGAVHTFKSNLPGGAHIRKSTTPGVGSYDPGVTKSGLSDSVIRSRHSLSKEGLSMFASTNEGRKTLAKDTTDAHVGPGTYAVENMSLGGAQMILEKCITSTNPRLPGFNTSTPARAASAPRSRSPAPGSYEVPEFLKISVAPSEVPPLRSPMFRSSSAQRKPLVNPEQGDPGAYVGPNSPAGVHQGHKEDIAAKSRRSFNRNVGTGRAAFNATSAARASTPPPRSARGGPAEHDYEHLYACGQASTRGAAHTFKSALTRGAHVRKSDTPGVGSYNPEVTKSGLSDSVIQSRHSLSKEGLSMFASTIEGRKTLAKDTTDAHVGPGTYAVENMSLGGAQMILEKCVTSTNPRLPGFASSEPRDTDP